MSRKVIVKLMGGLGNQMFQYAFGLFLNKKGFNVVFDDSFFRVKHDKSITPRNLELTRYNLKLKNIKRSFFGFRFVRLVVKAIGIILRKDLIYIKESKFSLEKLSQYSFLEGYWHDLTYVESVKEELKREFEFEMSLSPINQDLIRRIKDNKVLSIHVRRGDYITNQSAASHHGICSLDYYKEAFELVQKKNQIDIICIFSDDIKWCQENFKFSQEVIFASSNSIHPHEDIYVMSLCNYHIIANSSFSWWGAYLSEQTLVIYPRNWFISSSSHDIFSEQWISM